jgi:hypothetical protein
MEDRRIILRNIARYRSMLADGNSAETLKQIAEEMLADAETLLARLIPLSQVNRYVVSWARASGSGNGRDGDLQWRGREP